MIKAKTRGSLGRQTVVRAIAQLTSTVLRAFVLQLLLVLLVACGGRQSVEQLASTMVAETVAAEPATPDLAATARVEQRVATEAAETADAEASSTAAAAATLMGMETATSQAATADAAIQGTARAEPMMALLRDLQQEGHLESQTGTHMQLPNYRGDYASGPVRDDFGFMETVWYSYDYRLIEPAPSDFVFRTDLRWENFDESANKIAGCGLVFRVNQRTGDLYMVWFSGMGHVNHIQTVNRDSRFVSNISYRNLGWPDGSAEFLLVAQGSKISVFINSDHVDTREDEALDEGAMGYVILSGDSRGFGTRCTMTDTDLWILDS
jgi:hypothetical protein